MTKEAITPELLNQILDYNPDDGTLTWRHRAPETFLQNTLSQQVVANRWNARLAGKPAFTALSHGYPCGRIHNKGFRAHQVAWAMYYGEWSSEIIDHIDGDPTNNRISNLRQVTYSGNARNQKRHKRNKSGRTGVDFDKARGLWRAYIGRGGKQTIIGRYQSKDEAIAARSEAELRLGFHANHGRA